MEEVEWGSRVTGREVSVVIKWWDEGDEGLGVKVIECCWGMG